MQSYHKAGKKTKLKTSGAHRRIRLLMVAVSCFLMWAGVTLWNQQGSLNAKAAQVISLEEKLQDLQQKSEDYKLEVTRLNDSEYIEQKIRKDYHYTRMGETMFDTPRSHP